METLIVKVKESGKGQQRFEFLLELLRALPDVEVEVQPAITPEEVSQVHEFLKTAGQWADRDIDAAELRQRAWTRGNSGS